MNTVKLISVFMVVSIIATGCNVSKQATCSMSEYIEYHYSSSENAQCAEVYESGDMLYGFGEGEMRGGNEEMLTRVAQANAISDLGQKAAGITDRIKGSIFTLVEQNSEGETVTREGIETSFEIRMQGVETVGEQCEETVDGTTCYMLVKMPRQNLLETASANLKEMDETLHERWTTSSEYEKLRSEL